MAATEEGGPGAFAVDGPAFVVTESACDVVFVAIQRFSFRPCGEAVIAKLGKLEFFGHEGSHVVDDISVCGVWQGMDIDDIEKQGIERFIAALTGIINSATRSA